VTLFDFRSKDPSFIWVERGHLSHASLLNCFKRILPRFYGLMQGRRVRKDERELLAFLFCDLLKFLLPKIFGVV
jgi:hypothetical protein